MNSPISVRLFPLKTAQKLKRSQGKIKPRFEVIGLEDPNKKYRIACKLRPVFTLPKENCIQRGFRKSGFSRFAWLKVATQANVPFYIKVNIASLRKRFNIDKKEIREALKKSADLTEVLQKKLHQINPPPKEEDETVPLLMVPPEDTIPPPQKIAKEIQPKRVEREENLLELLPIRRQKIPETKEDLIECTTQIMKRIKDSFVEAGNNPYFLLHECTVSCDANNFKIGFWLQRILKMKQEVVLSDENNLNVNTRPASEVSFLLNLAAFAMASVVYYSIPKFQNLEIEDRFSILLRAARLSFQLATRGFNAVQKEDPNDRTKDFFVGQTYNDSWVDSDQAMINMTCALAVYAITGNLKTEFRKACLSHDIVSVDPETTFDLAFDDGLSFIRTIDAILLNKDNESLERIYIAECGNEILQFLEKNKKLFKR